MNEAREAVARVLRRFDRRLTRELSLEVADDVLDAAGDALVSPAFKTACEIVLAEGYVPVQREPYERLRAWLDENGWPPKDWMPLGVSGE